MECFQSSSKDKRGGSFIKKQGCLTFSVVFKPINETRFPFSASVMKVDAGRLPARRSGVPSELSGEDCDGGETRGWAGALGSGPSFLTKAHTPNILGGIWICRWKASSLQVRVPVRDGMCRVRPFQRRLFLLLEDHFLQLLLHQRTRHCTCWAASHIHTVYCDKVSKRITGSFFVYFCV